MRWTSGDSERRLLVGGESEEGCGSLPAESDCVTVSAAQSTRRKAGHILECSNIFERGEREMLKKDRRQYVRAGGNEKESSRSGIGSGRVE
jgi:hypothetical protein